MSKKKEEKLNNEHSESQRSNIGNKDYKKLYENLVKENAELNEQMMRERADATNVRKRAEEEKLKLGGFYKALVIKELLPIIDNFERSLKAVPENLENDDYVKGVQGIVKQFEQTLSKLGVERIKTVGEHFDPELHEAVTHEEGDSDEEIVTEELQSGYMIEDQVIRHAMVRVKS